MISGQPLRLTGNATRRSRMLSDAEGIERAAQTYVAIKSEVTMQTLGTVLPELAPRVFGWLGERGISPVGAPFWKYNVVDMDRGLGGVGGGRGGAGVDGGDPGE